MKSKKYKKYLCEKNCSNDLRNKNFIVDWENKNENFCCVTVIVKYKKGIKKWNKNDDVNEN